jgi:hypothetical protein
MHCEDSVVVGKTVGKGQALGVQKLDSLRISRESVHEDGKVVSPKHRPPLPLTVQEISPGTHLC